MVMTLSILIMPIGFSLDFLIYHQASLDYLVQYGSIGYRAHHRLSLMLDYLQLNLTKIFDYAQVLQKWSEIIPYWIVGGLDSPREEI